MITIIEKDQDLVRQSVRAHYGTVAKRESGCGCAPTCCVPEGALPVIPGKNAEEISHGLGYSSAQVDSVPEGSNLGLGCGNPLVIASLKSGQTVLDLGSGAGFDAFLASTAVGPGGQVIGVDMTAEMVSKARAYKAKGSYSNVDFRLGEIENLPVANSSVDVIISNCVVNLSPDKAQVFREAFRVLKPGGRIAISDILATAPIPESVRGDLALHVGCVAGASLVEDVERFLHDAGFTKVEVRVKEESRDFIREWFPERGVEKYIASANIEAVKP
jgi:ubiquinone/menaquinone biosynthesis C-methylase UbiE